MSGPTLDGTGQTSHPVLGSMPSWGHMLPQPEPPPPNIDVRWVFRSLFVFFLLAVTSRAGCKDVFHRLPAGHPFARSPQVSAPKPSA